MRKQTKFSSRRQVEEPAILSDTHQPVQEYNGLGHAGQVYEVLV